MMINNVLVVENKNAGATLSEIHVYLERQLDGKWKVEMCIRDRSSSGTSSSGKSTQAARCACRAVKIGRASCRERV